MKTVGIALALLASLSASPSKLVSLDVDEGPVENGKTLKMELREIERQGDESTIHVRLHSGGSVSSSMFIVKGSCAIAKSRGAKYFRQTSESEAADGAWVYTVAFANTPTQRASRFQTQRPHQLTARTRHFLTACSQPTIASCWVSPSSLAASAT